MGESGVSLSCVLWVVLDLCWTSEFWPSGQNIQFQTDVMSTKSAPHVGPSQLSLLCLCYQSEITFTLHDVHTNSLIIPAAASRPPCLSDPEGNTPD